MTMLSATGMRYRVYFTPRVSQFVYGTEIEVTDHITFNGINQIKRAIDSQDYQIGAYYYSDVEFIASNDNGYFNEASDLRSIFTFLRDRTKVRVVFENVASDTITFYGLISEEATRIDAIKETMTFRALSRDSVIRNTKVPAGVVSNGSTCKNAILNMLANSVISSVLTTTASNVNPTVDFTIDDGSAFDNQPTQEAINQLLLASNSVMIIDSSANVIIKSREPVGSASDLDLYGPYDEQRRQNIVDVKNFNTGLQRTFTSLNMTDGNGITTNFTNTALGDTYGYRSTDITFAFITSQGTINTVGAALLAEFQVPKYELEVEVPTSIATDIDLLNIISINWPLRIVPYTKFLPIVGITPIGDSTYPLPNKYGSLQISRDIAFKVIEIDQDPNTFTTILKVRQIGTTLSDGFFTVPTSSIVGYAVIGIAPIGGTGTISYNPSVIGAAVIANTEVA